jgi:integrase
MRSGDSQPRQGCAAASCSLSPWRALDLDHARLQIDQQLIAIPGGCTFGPPKSKRSERTIALDPVTVDALRAHREVQQLERDLAGAAYDDQDLVFCNELGGVIYPKLLTTPFAKARRAAGIPTGTLHILRHTAATLALTATPPVRLHIVAGRLGDDPTTLLSTYATCCRALTCRPPKRSPQFSLTIR